MPNIIECGDGVSIDIDKYQEIYSCYSEFYGSGHDRIYYSKENDNYFVDSNKNGNDGVWDDLAESFEYFYSSISDNENAGNEIFNIDVDEYFEFKLDRIILKNIDEEYKICVCVNIDNNYTEAIVMDIETKKTYIVDEFYNANDEFVEKLSEINISFNCAYVGSSDGEDCFYVKKELVIEKLGEDEDYSFEEFCSFDWGEHKEWTDFGYMLDSSSEEYVVKYGNHILEEHEFDCICKEKDII